MDDPEDQLLGLTQHLGELANLVEHLSHGAPVTADDVQGYLTGPEARQAGCYTFLQSSLCRWLAEQLQHPQLVSVSDKPDQPLRATILSQLGNKDLLAGLVDRIDEALNGDSQASQPNALGMAASLKDATIPDMEDGARLIEDLGHDDRMDHALTALTANTHMLEDICFGPLWPALCCQLSGLLAASTTQDRQQRCLAFLQQLADTCGYSSTTHAADLLQLLLPRLGKATLEVPLHKGLGTSTASLLDAASAMAPAFVEMFEMMHALLCSLATDLHLLVPSQAESTLAHVCSLALVGLEQPPPAAPAVLQLSALDILWLVDTDMTWWQRLYCSNRLPMTLAHTTRIMEAAAAKLDRAQPIGVTTGAAVALLGGILLTDSTLVPTADHAMQEQCLRVLGDFYCRLADAGSAGPALLELAGGALASLAAAGIFNASSPILNTILQRWQATVQGMHRELDFASAWPALSAQILEGIMQGLASSSPSVLTTTTAILRAIIKQLAPKCVGLPLGTKSLVRFAVWLVAMHPYDNALKTAIVGLYDSTITGSTVPLARGSGAAQAGAQQLQRRVLEAGVAVLTAAWEFNAAAAAALTHGSLLDTAAQRLVQQYQESSGIGPKTRAMRAATFAACSTQEAQQAFLSAGLSRVLIEQLGSALSHGLVASPGDADAASTLSTHLKALLCWPGFGAKAAAGDQAVVNLLQELVSWLDIAHAGVAGVPPTYSAAVALECCSAFCQNGPDAAAALGQVPNARALIEALCTINDDAIALDNPWGVHLQQLALNIMAQMP